MQTLTINATLVDVDDEDGDFLAKRGADIDVPDGVDHRQVVTLLFDGFVDRLKATGITAENITNFT